MLHDVDWIEVKLVKLKMQFANSRERSTILYIAIVNTHVMPLVGVSVLVVVQYSGSIDVNPRV